MKVEKKREESDGGSNENMDVHSGAGSESSQGL